MLEGDNHPRNLMEFQLMDNFRNTWQIFELAKPFNQTELTTRGPEGRKVELIEVKDLDEISQAIGHQLHHLVHEEGIVFQHIAVLTGVSKERSRLGKIQQVGYIGLTRDLEKELNKVRVESNRRFKGLDQQGVIMTELEETSPEDARTLLYIGITRARTHLIVLGTKLGLDQLGKWHLPGRAG